MDSVEAFIGAVLQGGFSVAVAAFLLLRMERELRALREAITLLRHCQTCKLSPWFGELQDFIREGEEINNEVQA